MCINCSDSEEDALDKRSKKDKKKHKKHKHKHKHSSDKHKHKQKRRKNRDQNSDEERDTDRKRARLDDYVDNNGFDESDLEKLEAARAALTAELNGVHEEQYGSHHDGLEHLAQLQEASYNMAEAERAAMERRIRGSSDMGLAITIKGDRKDESRSVSDKSYKKEKRQFKETVPQSREENVVKTGSIGLIANYGSNENSDSEEEGEIDRDERAESHTGLNDELLEYAMNEDDDYHGGKRLTDESYNSYEREYEEFKRKKDKDRKKEKEKKEREKEKKAAEKREKEKRKEKEKKEKEARRKEKEDVKRSRERKFSEMERSRYILSHLFLFVIMYL